MRIETMTAAIRIVLSERNLKALLSKLTMPDSARTIFMTSGDDSLTVYVSSEPDDQHYNGRIPGPMHPKTEAALNK